jgi:hypothetical protein
MIDPKTGFKVWKLKHCKDGYWAFESNPRNGQYWIVHFDADYPASPNNGPYGSLSVIAEMWIRLE